MAIINGTPDAETIPGTIGDDEIYGQGGDDTILGDAGVDMLDGGGGNDLLMGDADSDALWGGDGNDQLSGGAEYDDLYGGAGDDLLDGGTGGDHMEGGTGDDYYYVDDISDAVIELADEGNDSVVSSISWTLPDNVENLELNGLGNVNGYGNSGDNLIVGYYGNNRLDGKGGKDVLIGGQGNDQYVVHSDQDLVIEYTDEGYDTVYTQVSYTLRDNIEALVINGYVDADGTGNSLDNLLVGSAGNNMLDGKAGADTMSGGVGNDTYIVDNAGDTVTEYEGQGTDTVESSINWTLGANLENLTLTGTASIDGTGNELDNVITGNGGSNVLTGGAGNDTYIVQNAGDQVIEAASEGNDTVQSSISYELSDNVENLTLTGTANINGTGNSGDNLITGNDGNNVLDGKGGIDTMDGGLGNDTYIVDELDEMDSISDSGGIDTVQSSVAWMLGADFENLTLTGSADINGQGNGGNNILTGNSGSNEIWGAGGNDTLDGKEGADILHGESGDDSYYVDALDQVIENADEGNDTVYSSNTYTLGDNVENLVLTGTAEINGTGNALDNVITGNDARNIIDGGAGSDTMQGGKGNDLYYVDNAEDKVIELSGEGADMIWSEIDWTLGDNIEGLLLSGSGNLNATGNSLDNTIFGNNDSNIIDGKGGYDTMYGGDGDDTYIVDSEGEIVSEGIDMGIDLVKSSVNWVLGANVENLTLTGTANLNGTGNALDNEITGNDGNNILWGGIGGQDTLKGGKGDDLYIVDGNDETIIEAVGEGSDTVVAEVSHTLAANIEKLLLTGTDNIDGTGNAQDNVIIGNSGHNRLDGGAGADVLKGGAGNDTYVVDANDTVNDARGQGTDTVVSDVSTTLGKHIENLILTGNGNINATGNNLDNIIIANGGDNVIDGGRGIDTASYETAAQGVDVNLSIRGEQNTGAGHDSLIDVENLTGSNFNDVLTGNWMNNVLHGANGSDVLDGGAGNDTLYGDLGADTLLGSDGNDLLDGGADDDTLNGGAGNDVLTGGVGGDIFLFGSALGAGNVDTLTDFNTAVDTLQLDASIFTKLAGGFSADNFVSSTAGVAADANDYLVYDSDAGKLYYDADGNGAGAAVLFATFSDLAAVNVDDFAIA